MTVEELLSANGIELRNPDPGQRYYLTCPKCSAQRRTGDHRKSKVLCVIVEPGGDRVGWNCSHCGWKGPEKGALGKKPNGADDLPFYIYRDAGGVIRFRKVRRTLPGGDKTFWIQHPNGAGGWAKSAGGVNTKIFLYRADEVAEAIAEGRSIAIVEGEKDCDALWRLGFPATCSSSGAAKLGQKPKWYPEHSAQLKGADIVVFNDNDASGYAHADTTCKLSIGAAKHVRRLDLKDHWPEIPPKGDVSDWLAQGHGREELAALIDGAPDYASAATTAETAQPATAQSGNGDATGAPVDDDAELARLARLPLIEYERERAGEAKRLGLRAPMLDRLIAAKRAELGIDGGDGKQGRPIEFPESKPWPSPVGGAALLDAVAVALGRHVVMSEHQHVAVALWVVHAYLLDRLMISPRLAIRSAVKGSGKTTLLDVLARLVPRPLLAANVSASAIFRVIAAHGPTLLIDEADTLFSKDGDEALRGVLNAGHRKGGAVLRSVGDDFEPRAFNCYAATVIACIGQLPGTLADRSVDIVLARRRPSEAITPFRLDRTDPLDLLARQIARWAKDNGERLGRDPAMPPGLHNRAADNWRGLLAIADLVGGDWPEKSRIAAGALAGGEPDEVSRTELLLSDIRAIFTAANDDEITSASLILQLCEIMPRPWAEYGRSGKPITQNKLARLLKPLGIGPGLIGEDRLHGYRMANFADAFERYLAPLFSPSNRSTAHNADGSSTYDMSRTAHPENGRAAWNSAKSFSHNEMSGGAVWKGEASDESDVCAVCGEPGAHFCAYGNDVTAWLHPGCQAAFIAGERAGDV